MMDRTDHVSRGPEEVFHPLQRSTASGVTDGRDSSKQVVSGEKEFKKEKDTSCGFFPLFKTSIPSLPEDRWT